MYRQKNHFSFSIPQAFDITAYDGKADDKAEKEKPPAPPPAAPKSAFIKRTPEEKSKPPPGDIKVSHVMLLF